MPLPRLVNVEQPPAFGFEARGVARLLPFQPFPASSEFGMRFTKTGGFVSKGTESESKVLRN